MSSARRGRGRGRTTNRTSTPSGPSGSTKSNNARNPFAPGAAASGFTAPKGPSHHTNHKPMNGQQQRHSRNASTGAYPSATRQADAVGFSFGSDNAAPYQQRYQVLRKQREQERAHAIANGFLADPDKPRTLADAITPVGTCQDMCPEYERVERVVQKDVWTPETDPDTQAPAEHRMVKKFRRAAAGVDEQLPSDLRPPPVLKETVDYLFSELIGQSDTLSSVHHFVWDRTRAIRNDFSIQQLTKEPDLRIAIECYERIARFHILSLHHFAEQGRAYDHYDWYQEREQLDKTLLSLLQFYDDSRTRLTSPNEAEFRAYCVIFQIRSFVSDIEHRVQDWPLEVLQDARVQHALTIYAAACNVTDPQGPMRPATQHPLAQANPQRFWKLVESKQVSYLMSCVAELYFNQVRRTALTGIWSAYRSGGGAGVEDWTIEELSDLLAFHDEEQTENFLERYGFSVRDRNDGQRYLDLTSVGGKHLPEPAAKVEAPTHSYEMVEYKRYGRTFPAVINGLSVKEARKRGLIEPEFGGRSAKSKGNSLFVTGESDDEADPDSAQTSGKATEAPNQLNPFATSFAPGGVTAPSSDGVSTGTNFGTFGTAFPSPGNNSTEATKTNPFSSTAPTFATPSSQSTIFNPFASMTSGTPTPDKEGSSFPTSQPAQAMMLTPSSTPMFNYGTSTSNAVNTSSPFSSFAPGASGSAASAFSSVPAFTSNMPKPIVAPQDDTARPNMSAFGTVSSLSSIFSTQSPGRPASDPQQLISTSSTNDPATTKPLSSLFTTQSGPSSANSPSSFFSTQSEPSTSSLFNVSSSFPNSSSGPGGFSIGSAIASAATSSGESGRSVFDQPAAGETSKTGFTFPPNTRVTGVGHDEEDASGPRKRKMSGSGGSSIQPADAPNSNPFPTYQKPEPTLHGPQTSAPTTPRFTVNAHETVAQNLMPAASEPARSSLEPQQFSKSSTSFSSISQSSQGPKDSFKPVFASVSSHATSAVGDGIASEPRPVSAGEDNARVEPPTDSTLKQSPSKPPPNGNMKTSHKGPHHQLPFPKSGGASKPPSFAPKISSPLARPPIGSQQALEEQLKTAPASGLKVDTRPSVQESLLNRPTAVDERSSFRAEFDDYSPLENRDRHRARVLDRLASELFVEEEHGIFWQYLEHTVGPMILETQLQVRVEREREAAERFRVKFLAMKYGRLWRELFWRQHARRKGAERRAKLRQSTAAWQRQSRTGQKPDDVADFRSVLTRSTREQDAGQSRSARKRAATDTGRLAGSKLTQRREIVTAVSTTSPATKKRHLSADHDERLPKQRRPTINATPDFHSIHVAKSVSHPSTPVSKATSDYPAFAAAKSLLSDRKSRTPERRRNTMQTDYFRLKAMGVRPESYNALNFKRPSVADDDSASTPAKRPASASSFDSSPRRHGLDLSRPSKEPDPFARTSAPPSLVPTTENAEVTSSSKQTSQVVDPDEELFAQARELRKAMAESSSMLREELDREEGRRSLGTSASPEETGHLRSSQNDSQGTGAFRSANSFGDSRLGGLRQLNRTKHGTGFSASPSSSSASNRPKYWDRVSRFVPREEYGLGGRKARAEKELTESQATPSKLQSQSQSQPQSLLPSFGQSTHKMSQTQATVDSQSTIKPSGLGSQWKSSNSRRSSNPFNEPNVNAAGLAQTTSNAASRGGCASYSRAGPSSMAGFDTVSIAGLPRSSPPMVQDGQRSSPFDSPSDFHTAQEGFGGTQFQPAQDPVTGFGLVGSSFASATQDGNTGYGLDDGTPTSDFDQAHADGDGHGVKDEAGPLPETTAEEEDEDEEEGTDVISDDYYDDDDEDEDIDGDAEDMNSELASFDEDDEEMASQPVPDAPTWLKGGNSADDAIEL